ncbi:hypothetical protein CFP56_023322 [Quercus suber]|uniref:RNase H type-1 domain-containing protein n=1 Tax=Quercus suber TaxID=58331 RepID=A0AAW0KAG9_QUESU
MSRRARSSGNHSPSSDNDTILASVQVAQTLQQHFDQGGDDTAPTRGIHIAHHTKSQCSVETTNASSQSHIGSGGGSSKFPQIEKGGGLGGAELDDELIFDLDIDLEANDMARQGTNNVGIGMVFRDHLGNVIATLSQKVDLIHSVEMAEALVARRVVVLARELSLFNMIIEGDFLRVIQALKCSG